MADAVRDYVAGYSLRLFCFGRTCAHGVTDEVGESVDFVGDVVAQVLALAYYVGAYQRRSFFEYDGFEGIAFAQFGVFLLDNFIARIAHAAKGSLAVGSPAD